MLGGGLKDGSVSEADKAAYIDHLAHPLDSLVLLSEVLNFDFASLGMDEAFSDQNLASISGLQALRDRVIRASGKPNPTVRDFIQHSGRGTLREMPVFVGSAAEVAEIEFDHRDGSGDGSRPESPLWPGCSPGRCGRAGS